MSCTGFKFGLLFNVPNVFKLMTIIYAPVWILKTIYISPTSNFTCQGSINFFRLYRYKELCFCFSVFISRMLCVLDLQHIVKWFHLSQLWQIFPFAGQLSNMWDLLHFSHLGVFPGFCGYFFPSWLFCALFFVSFYCVDRLILNFFNLVFSPAHSYELSR